MKRSNFSGMFCFVSVLMGAFMPAVLYGQGVPESIALFQENCAVCHGEELQGTSQGTPLLGDLLHGDSMADIVASISGGYTDAGMPTWRDLFTPDQIRNVALYILETRAHVGYRTFNHREPLSIPPGTVESELHDFRLRVVADGLDALPFSIAPLPDGRFLLTEKKFGVRVIEADGSQSAYIQGTPAAYSDTSEPTLNGFGNERGWGWLFDIALHPDYRNNGWIYLYYGDRCSDCNILSREQEAPVSMNRLVRGRIEEGQWIDQEVIWEADIEHYGTMVDVAAGGRVDFDDSGHLYLSVGMKGPDNHHGVQDLATPWGKIHRINDDGSIPLDNPFVGRNDVYRSIYTYGHRSPQGLVFNQLTGQLWGTEHGPRGGDEVNLLLPGRNYGWPLHSRGMNYNGTAVDFGRVLNIPFELADIEQPVVDLTPSPAVSSLIVVDSQQFPAWRGQFLVGSLKARSLFRFRIENNRLLEQEILLEGLARIRDIEQGFGGEIYLLLEHQSGSRIVQLEPVD